MSATINSNLPALSNEGGLSAYLEQIKKFPMLAAEEEYMLAKNWKAKVMLKLQKNLLLATLDSLQKLRWVIEDMVFQ